MNPRFFRRRSMLLAGFIFLALPAMAQDPFDYIVDPNLQPYVTEIPGDDVGQAPPRPVAAVQGPDGGTDLFIANELIMLPFDDVDLQDFLSTYGAVVAGDETIPQPPPSIPSARLRAVPQTSYTLVRLDLSTVIVDPAEFRNRMTNAGFTGLYRFSSDDAVKLSHVLAGELPLGRRVEANLLFEPQQSCDNECVSYHTQEHPGVSFAPTTTLPNEGFLDAFNANHQRWWNDPDFRVTDAWQIMECLGEDFTDPLVRRPLVAILDGGFQLNADYYGFPTVVQYDFHNNDYDVDNQPGPGSCRGFECPWHGQGALGNAVAAADNRYGGVGTGGTVASPMAFRLPLTAFATARAIRTAQAWGADVVNMSYGGFCDSWCREFTIFSGFGYANDASRDATAAGVVVVAAAGNRNQRIGSGGGFYKPCMYDGVICVGAIDRRNDEDCDMAVDEDPPGDPDGDGNPDDDGDGLIDEDGPGAAVTRACFSNFGSAVDIWAPGVDVRSTTKLDLLGVDNDCDGEDGEDPPTGIDNDGDGLIDEDPVGDADGDGDPDDDGDGLIDEDDPNDDGDCRTDEDPVGDADGDGNPDDDCDGATDEDLIGDIDGDGFDDDDGDGCSNEDTVRYVFGGTSAASPFTAGVIAMLKAVDPMLNRNDILTVLQSTAGTSPHPLVGNRLVDAREAVRSAAGLVESDLTYGDGDGDLHADACDNCPAIANGIEQATVFGVGNQQDLDFDGVGDPCDNCPRDDNGMQDDVDSDSVGDVCDNCPNAPNASQRDRENGDRGDGVGDACDNCPDDDNPGQENNDGDSWGDVCDPDDDNDGILDDGDGSGERGDNRCAGGETTDCDDNCPLIYNPLQEDQDGDGFGDVCDVCSTVADPFQLDSDVDCGPAGGPRSCGDACDDCTDSDGDGRGNPGAANLECPEDLCPDVLPPDTNGDGVIDVNDEHTNRDGDGFGDDCDACPFRFSTSNADDDGDGLGNQCDPFPFCPRECEVAAGAGGLPGSICAACPGGMPGRGTPQDCLTPAEAGPLGSFFCLSGIPDPSDSFGICPEFLRVVDQCCFGGGDCLGPGVSLLAPDAFGQFELPAVQLGYEEGDGFGFAGIFFEDFDQGGTPDYLVSAPAALNLQGLASGVVTLISSETNESLGGLLGEFEGSLFGYSIARDALGIHVGAPFEAPPGAAAAAIAGSASTTNDLSAGHSYLYDNLGILQARFDGTIPGSQFGYHVGFVPDQDGDQLADLLIGAPGAGEFLQEPGRIYLYSSTGQLLLELVGQQPGERYGSQFVVLGDVDGDQVTDVAVAAPRADTAIGSGAGRVEVVNLQGNVLYQLEGDKPFGEFGGALSGGPDMDGDGLADFLVGAALAESDAGAEGGRASLYSASGVLLARFGGANPGDRLGRNLLLASDLNGDGRGDLMIGSPVDDATSIFFSSTDEDADGAPEPDGDNCPSIYNPAQADSDGDGFGDACDLCPFVGELEQSDLDQDGFGDACDCSPFDAAAYPGAVEVNDGKDSDCDGLIDEMDPSVIVVGSPNGPILTWEAQPGATGYQVAVAGDPRFLAGCGLQTVTQTSLPLVTDPGPDQIQFILVHTATPSAGSWGSDSTGTERSLANCQ